MESQETPLDNLVHCWTISNLIFFFPTVILFFQNLLPLSVLQVGSDVHGAQLAGNLESGHHRVFLGILLNFKTGEDFVRCFGQGLSITPTEQLSWGASLAKDS